MAADQSRAPLRRDYRTRTPRSGTACTASRCILRNPDVLYMQKHWDVMRSDNAGDSWSEVSGNLPSDFGFAIDVHAHEPETVYVVPITSDSEHFPPEGKLRVYRSRTGGNEWEPLTKGLPQEHCYVDVLARRDGRGHARRLRRVLRHHRWSGLRVGQLWRLVGAHRSRPSRGAVGRSPNAGMIRVVLPAHLKMLAKVSGEVELEVTGTPSPAQRDRRSRGALSRAAWARFVTP